MAGPTPSSNEDVPPSPPSSPFSPPPRPVRSRSNSVTNLWSQATRTAAAVELSDDMLDEMCAEALRRVVFAAIGETMLGMYRPVYVEDDARLRRMQRSLWGVTCHQLKVDRNLCLDAAPKREPGAGPPHPSSPFWHVFQAATNALSSMEGYPSPDEKRDAMVATVRSLFACVKNYHAAVARAAGGMGTPRRGSMQISADNLLGLFCHLIIHSGIRDLFAQMAYIYEFMSSSDRMARPGFYYTTIQSAMAYLTSEEVDVTPMCAYCEAEEPTVRCDTCHRLYCDACDVFVHGSPAPEETEDLLPGLRPVTREHVRRRILVATPLDELEVEVSTPMAAVREEEVEAEAEPEAEAAVVVAEEEEEEEETGEVVAVEVGQETGEVMASQ